MSGLAGVWNRDGRPVAPDGLAAMSRALAHRGREARATWVEGAVGLACRLARTAPESSRERQPYRGAGGEVVLFDGRLDNREDLRRRLGEEVGPPRADSGLVAAAYRRFGDGLPATLAGDFALAVWDPGRQRLLLARDALGVRPLYLCRARAGSSVLFASEIKALLAHPAVDARPDRDTLADFLVDHVRDPSRTFFEGISSVEPAHLIEVWSDSLAARRYWDFDPGRRLRLGSTREYAEAFREVLERAVRRRLRSARPVAVSVSGGLDSSSVLALALGSEGAGPTPPVLGVSYLAPEGSDADERRFLVDLEERLGTSIHRFPLGRGVLEDAAAGVWHNEMPWLDGHWNATGRFMTAVRELGTRVVLSGHWADELLFPQAYLVGMFRRLRWRAAWSHLDEFGRWMTDADQRFFRRRFLKDLVKFHVPRPLLPLVHRTRLEPRPWHSRDLRRRAARRAWKRRSELPGEGSAHFRSLYEEARSAHHVLCLEWSDKVAAMHGLEWSFPFLDRDVVSFLMAAPGEVVTPDGVPKGLLRTATRGLLPESIRRRRWKANFLPLIEEGVSADARSIVEELDRFREARRLGLVDDDAVVRSVGGVPGREELTGEEAVTDLLDLLALELWARVFFASGDHTAILEGARREQRAATASGGGP